jgi:hypothetical protein
MICYLGLALLAGLGAVLLVVLAALLAPAVSAASEHLQLFVTQPYLELHTGPGRGYPVFHVVPRDGSVDVLFRYTDWFKVRAPHGQEGWARRSELALTTLTTGDPAPIPPYPEFATHRWEIGAGYGVFNHQNLVTTWGDFSLTDSLDVEFVLQQALGTSSSSRVVAVVRVKRFSNGRDTGAVAGPVAVPRRLR